MRRWVPLVLLALVAAPVTLVATASPASACSCAEREPEEYVDAADVVATGTLTAVDRSPDAMGTDPVWYTVDIDEVYQGEAAETTTFASAADGASCGLENMQTGSRYVVFLTIGAASEPHVADGLVSGLCDGTQPYDGTGPMAAALSALGGEPPSPGSAGERPPAPSGTEPWLFAAGGALLVTGAIVLVLRLRRRRS